MTKKLSIKRGAKRGPDQENPEWTKADFARALPFSGLPEHLQRALMNPKRGEQKVPKKVVV